MGIPSVVTSIFLAYAPVDMSIGMLHCLKGGRGPLADWDCYASSLDQTFHNGSIGDMQANRS